MRLIRALGGVTLAPPGGRHLRSVLAIGGEDTVEPRAIDPWLGDPGGEPGDTVQGSKMTCAVPSRYGVFSVSRTLPMAVSDRRCSDTAGRLM